MQVIARRTLKEFWARHPHAEGPIRAWLSIAAKADWANVIQAGISSQSASLFAALTYDAASGVRLFRDQSANPRSLPDFERVGRNALLATPGLGLHPEFTKRLVR